MIEIVITLVHAGIILGIIFYLQFRPVDAKKAEAMQEELDERSELLKTQYGIVRHFDGKDEIQDAKRWKAFFVCFGLTIIDILVGIFTKISLEATAVLFVLALIVLIIGLVIVVQSVIPLFLVLIFIGSIGVLGDRIFTRIILSYEYAYVYLVAGIFALAIMVLLHVALKNRLTE